MTATAYIAAVVIMSPPSSTGSVPAVPLATQHTMATTLHDIIEHKRGEVDRAKTERPQGELEHAARDAEEPRNFFGAVVNGHTQGSTSVIAEVKHKSPSAGVIRDDFDAASIAAEYEKAGAAAISCLTDEHFFGGKLAYIQEIRDVVKLPVLRKDFIIDAYQVWEARAGGADAILLIAEVLSEGQLMDYMILAHELRMTSLVEAHNMDQLLKIQGHIGFPHAGYSLLGINNRDLTTMDTDLSHTIRLIDVVENTSIVVSESGISSPEDLDRLRQHGVHIVLVGESLMREQSPGEALARLIRMNTS